MITTILSLRASTGTPLELRNAAGYYTPGDGGGGDFYWDDQSQLPDNGGTIIQAGTAPGRWRRIYDGPVHVKWFGAIGDGNTDDTTAIRNCLTFSDDIYIDPGDYKITSQLNINSKRLSISSSPLAYLNKRFSSGDLIKFQSCPAVTLQVNVRNSLPDVLRFNDNGKMGNIPQFRVEGFADNIFSFRQCGSIDIHRCEITTVYGYSIFSFTDGFINFSGNYIHDNCYVDSCVQTWGHETLNVENNKFFNIALLPDNFIVVKDGIDTPQSFPGTAYAWQFGQALSILGNNMYVSGNVFENISGLSVGADHSSGTQLEASRIVILNNIFIADSDHIRGANPPGFIWIENHQAARVTGNRFSFRRRAVGDGQFQLCRFAVGRFNTEKPCFEYSMNTYIAADNANDTTATINILTENDDAIVNIENNKHHAPLSNFVFIGTKNATRPCEYLNVTGNDVVCNEFVMGYNEEVFTGSNFFKLPKQINITNNPKVICSGDFFNQRGEYGNSDFKLVISGNNILNSGNIYLINGTINAFVSQNNAPNTGILWNWAPTATQGSRVSVAGNTALGKINLQSATNLGCTLTDNIFTGEVILRDMLQESYVKGNTFLASVTVMGTVNYAHIVENLFRSRLLLINAIVVRSDISHNVFEGNGLGIYGYDPSSSSLKLDHSHIVRNTFFSDLTFNAIEFPDFSVFIGLNFITDNNITNRNDQPPMRICNKIGSANLIVSPVSGTTAERPTGQPVGLEYLDTTLQKKIIYWGSSWKDMAGNVV
ncbi:hypothetical protein [Chitinophaga sp. 212800010-3]|uniref:hypothetical protein n=1 Tax=unclassified Chitinophaga TaxID=2619133 RepID=UPI002DE98B10|nr:Pectate lyase superfamily protein [Chitinophaga sp. 212800010-3]